MGSVKNWSVDQTAEWLVREGFGNYTAGFISREIDGPRLLDLREIHVQKIFQNKEVERRFWAKVRRLPSVQPQQRQRHKSSGNNTPKNNVMFGHHGGRPQPDRGPALPPGRPHMGAHDRAAPALPAQHGAKGRVANPTGQHQMNVFRHVQRSFDDDDEWSDDDDDEPMIYENNDRNQQQPPPPPVQRRPVEPPSRPLFGGGYPSAHPQPQIPPRHAPNEEPDDMYLAVDNPRGESEFGKGKYQPDQVLPRSKHNQPYPLPSQDPHPALTQGRPPQLIPHFNQPPSEDDQDVYEQPNEPYLPARPEPLRGHRSSMPEPGNRHPIVPSRGSYDRNSASSLPPLGPRGGSTNSSNGNISHSSAGSSGENIDVMSGSPRGNKPPYPAFQDMKHPTNGFNNCPGRMRITESKPLPPIGVRPMPNVTAPPKPAPTSKPQPGFKPPIIQDLKAGLADITARRNKKLGDYEDSVPMRRPQNTDISTSPQRSQFSSSADSPTYDLKSQPWYKNIGRTDACSAINRNPQEGCFIVRPSSKQNPKVPYSLTVYSQNQLFNLIIRCRSDDNLYALGTQKINEVAKSSVAELIEHYKYSDLVLADDKGSVRLSGPP